MNYSCSQKKKGTEKVPSFVAYAVAYFPDPDGFV